MEIRRDEMFHFTRWLNLLLGILNLYYYVVGGGFHLFGIGMINVAIWAFTRR